MNLKELPGSYSILRLGAKDPVPEWAMQGPFHSVNRTSEELSIVCESQFVPAEIEYRSDQWKCLRVEGLLDFGQTGILSSIAGPLARAKISIFAISTYNTDYVLVKADTLERAKEALKKNGVSCAPEASV